MRTTAVWMLCGSLAAASAIAQTAAAPAAPASPAAPMAPGASPPNPASAGSVPSGQSTAPSTSDPTERHPPNVASPDNVQGTGRQRQNCKSGQATTNLNCNPGNGSSPK